MQTREEQIQDAALSMDAVQFKALVAKLLADNLTLSWKQQHWSQVLHGMQQQREDAGRILHNIDTLLAWPPRPDERAPFSALCVLSDLCGQGSADPKCLQLFILRTSDREVMAESYRAAVTLHEKDAVRRYMRAAWVVRQRLFSPQVSGRMGRNDLCSEPWCGLTGAHCCRLAACYLCE